MPEIKVEYVNKMCEFRVIRGLCGRIAWNLRNSLEFLRVLCRGRPLKHNVNRSTIDVNFASFVEYVGEWSEFCLIRSNFLEFSVDRQRSEIIIHDNTLIIHKH